MRRSCRQCTTRLIYRPVPRQQLIEAMSRISRNPRENVCQPCLRIDAVHLRGDDQTVHGRRALTAAIGPTEQPDDMTVLGVRRIRSQPVWTACFVAGVAGGTDHGKAGSIRRSGRP